MHDSVCMTVLNTGEDLFHVESGLVLGQTALLDHSVEELSSLAVIHHDEEVLAF
jgi:hypothetical protein